MDKTKIKGATEINLWKIFNGKRPLFSYRTSEICRKPLKILKSRTWHFIKHCAESKIIRHPRVCCVLKNGAQTSLIWLNYGRDRQPGSHIVYDWRLDFRSKPWWSGNMVLIGKRGSSIISVTIKYYQRDRHYSKRPCYRCVVRSKNHLCATGLWARDSDGDHNGPHKSNHSNVVTWGNADAVGDDEVEIRWQW